MSPSWIPELVIEMVTPGSETRDYEEKPPEYLAFGVMEYWIFDLEKEQVSILQRSGGRWASTVLSPTQTHKTRLLPGFDAFHRVPERREQDGKVPSDAAVVVHHQDRRCPHERSSGSPAGRTSVLDDAPIGNIDRRHRVGNGPVGERAWHPRGLVL